MEGLQSRISSDINLPTTGPIPKPCPLNPVQKINPGTSLVNPKTGMLSDIPAISPDHIRMMFISFKTGKKSIMEFAMEGPIKWNRGLPLGPN